jgi:DNA-binding MarR family transcriptional regulator
MRPTPRQKSNPAPPDDSRSITAVPGHLIRRMHQASTAIFTNEIAKSGYELTPVQYAALTTIANYPGLDQATLAAAIAYDRVTIGGVIDRLEQKGYVQRVIAAGDRRSRRLHLQPPGRAALDAAYPFVQNVQEEMLKGLSDKERGELLKLLRKALAGLGDTHPAPVLPPLSIAS